MKELEEFLQSYRPIRELDRLMNYLTLFLIGFAFAVLLFVPIFRR